MQLPKTNPREPSIPTAKVLASGTSNQWFPTQIFIAELHVITLPYLLGFFCIFNYVALLEILIN